MERLSGSRVDDGEASSNHLTRKTQGVTTRYNTDREDTLSVRLLDPDVLGCPICCEPLSASIFSCDNGHLLCSACIHKLMGRCPYCHSTIGAIRCRALEKVIEASTIPCPNARYGCNENIPYGDRFGHEKTCLFAPCICPIDFDNDGSDCPYTGFYKDVYNHFRDTHISWPFTWNTKIVEPEILLGFNPAIPTFYQEVNDGELFSLQIYSDEDGVYIRVNCIAPSACQFSCTMTILTVDGSLKREFMVKNVQRLRNYELRPQDDFTFIPSHMLLSTEFDEEYLNLQMWLCRGRCFCHA